MYYLRIIDNKIGFAIEGVNNILDTDIPISEEEYSDFFKRHTNGEQFKVKLKPSGHSLFDYIETVEVKYIPSPKSEIQKLKEYNELLKKQQSEQDEIMIENAFAIANIELGGLY